VYFFWTHKLGSFTTCLRIRSTSKRRRQQRWRTTNLHHYVLITDSDKRLRRDSRRDEITRKHSSRLPISVDRLRCESLSQAADNEHWSNGYNSYQAARQQCHVYATTRLLQQRSDVARLVPPYWCPELVVCWAKTTIDSVLDSLCKTFSYFSVVLFFSFIAILIPFHHHHHYHHHFLYHTTAAGLMIKFQASKHITHSSSMASLPGYWGTCLLNLHIYVFRDFHHASLIPILYQKKLQEVQSDTTDPFCWIYNSLG